MIHDEDNKDSKGGKIIKSSIITYDTPHTLLNSFCAWQHRARNNINNDPWIQNNDNYDVAVLITRRRLCGSLQPCSMVGLANVGTICVRPDAACFIVEDTGLNAAFTIAHELGHVMGIPHDDQDQCLKYYEEEKSRIKKKKGKKSKKTFYKANIMASVQKSINHIWAWSSCSRHFINNHLR